MESKRHGILTIRQENPGFPEFDSSRSTVSVDYLPTFCLVQISSGMGEYADALLRRMPYLTWSCFVFKYLFLTIYIVSGPDGVGWSKVNCNWRLTIMSSDVTFLCVRLASILIHNLQPISGAIQTNFVKFCNGDWFVSDWSNDWFIMAIYYWFINQWLFYRWLIYWLITVWLMDCSIYFSTNR